MRSRYDDILKEVHGNPDAIFIIRRDPSLQDLPFERPKDDQSEVDMDIDDTSAMSDETFGEFEDVEEAHY